MNAIGVYRYASPASRTATALRVPGVEVGKRLLPPFCRKVAEAEDGGTIEVWGDGAAIRSYTYVDDLVEGIYMLMQSDLHGAVNIGCPQYVSVDELANTIAEVAGKMIHLKHVEGPVGVQSRNFSNERIYSIGWVAKYYLRDGIAKTYPWVEEQVRMARLTKDIKPVV